MAINESPDDLLRIKIYVTQKRKTIPLQELKPRDLDAEGVADEGSSNDVTPKEASNMEHPNKDTAAGLNPFAVACTDSFATFPGRPDLHKILQEEVDATDFSDRLAVGVCGPSAMAKDLARAVSNMTIPQSVMHGEYRKNIRFHLEEFGW